MMPATGATEQTKSTPRLLPARAFPPYTYIPGSDSPHPVRDPRGHSYGRTEPASVPPDPDNWQGCVPFLWGIDLFNAGYYWEAHEAWESAWIAAGRTGPTADFLKALIKLAAAGVKLREQNEPGARRHLLRAMQLLDAAAIHEPCRTHVFGLSLEVMRNAARQLQSDALQCRHSPNGQPMPVLGLTLRPEHPPEARRGDGGHNRPVPLLPG